MSLYLFAIGTSGISIDKTQNCFVVAGVDQTAGNLLKPGDCITHVGGIAYPDILGYVITSTTPAQDRDQLTVLRNAEQLKVLLHYMPLTFSRFISAVGPYLLFIILALVLCVSALRQTPTQQPTGLFVITLSCFALLFVSQFPIQLGILKPAMQSSAAILTMWTNWLGFSAWLHFALRFPMEQRIWTGQPGRLALIYILPPLVAILAAVIVSDAGAGLFGWLQRLRRWAVPIFIVAIWGKHWHDLRTTTSTSVRNQLRLILTGGGIGVGTYFFLYLLPSLFLDRPLVPFYVVAMAGLLVPLSLFLALVRYRLLDADRFISWTITHMVLVGGLLAVYSGTLYAFKQAVWGSNILSESVFTVFILLIALFFAPVRDRLRYWIDVLFFKQKLNYQTVLHAFSSKVATAIRLPELTDLIVNHLPGEFILSQAGLIISTGDHHRSYPPHRIGTLEEIPKRLNREQPFLLCEKGHADPALARDMNTLIGAGYQLVLNLQSRSAGIGILLLGSPKNKPFYSGRDIQALSTLANQVATAVQNALNFESLELSREKLKNMFAKVVHAEKLAAIGEMTAVLAHEIKNPLGVIRSSAQFLATEPDPDANRHELLGFIVDEVDRVTLVVNNLLGLARYVPPEFKPLEMDQLIASVVSRWLQSDDHNPKVAVRYECRPMVNIHSDRQQLTQVLVNLIRNSEDVMPEGGLLEIDVDWDDENDGVVICLKDNGPGVAPEDLPKLWRKFYTTKKEGVGLGLPVCKQIVEAHDGSIRIDSAPGRGLTATIRLPRCPNVLLSPQEQEFEPMRHGTA